MELFEKLPDCFPKQLPPGIDTFPSAVCEDVVLFLTIRLSKDLGSFLLKKKKSEI